MNSLQNLIFTELTVNKSVAVGWNIFWFCVELLYPTFRNKIVTLQARGYPKQFSSWCWQNISSKNVAIRLNAVDITASSNWKALHVFAVIWSFFSVLGKLRSWCLIETSQSSKYCLAKDISKWLTICIITQIKSVISDGIHRNSWQNATN